MVAHYAGVGGEMDTILAIGERHGLLIFKMRGVQAVFITCHRIQRPLDVERDAQPVI